MATTKAAPIKDYLGNVIDNSYFLDAKDIYCVTCSNGDTFQILNIKRRAVAITTTCGDLIMSYSAQPLAASPAAPALPAGLPLSDEGRILIPDREDPHWFYIPKGVETLFFYAGRQGTFNAIFMDVPDQVEDSPV